jgi:hypothetical protein
MITVGPLPTTTLHGYEPAPVRHADHFKHGVDAVSGIALPRPWLSASRVVRVGQGPELFLPLPSKSEVVDLSRGCVRDWLNDAGKPCFCNSIFVYLVY